MSKSLRLSEKWFRRGLWLVAVVFASFLIGLGSTIVGDLPRVEHRIELDDFIDRAAAEPLRNTVRNAERVEQEAVREREQADLKLLAARQASRAARETFSNWLATRHATAQPDQDAELIARTKALDALKQKEDEAERAVGAERQIALDARQSRQRAAEQLAKLEDEARTRMDAENRRVELRVFLYRLALTLPLLVIAGWLFAKKRKSTWWPFVWGFIFFALFAFFVELVPYLPSYGGYVRYAVGILITVLVGRYAIVALNRYLERQKAAESQPDTVRRNDLGYDTALARLAKGVCPGCERPVDLKNTEIDFCPHCGIGLFDHCPACKTRKSAFARFCHACGTGAAAAAPRDPSLPQVQPASTT
ncbi:Membrane protein involved in colicin uptake [Variovorax sp. HW608]|uniref:double zinc ribbon domain-containing protein n=1 Tax=Variovorax sp. HW608 TaxID=1034889 RepID=UPI00081F7C29|nr:zinc ribbon domain-containing protein [Variovorax sp. HW608]SCK34638.1 Membrane protein involved in colicin uptake [Variovorax sp. HW608]